MSNTYLLFKMTINVIEVLVIKKSMNYINIILDHSS